MAITTKTYKSKPAPKGFVCPDGGKVSKKEYMARLKAHEDEQADVEEFKKERKQTKAEKKTKK